MPAQRKSNNLKLVRGTSRADRLPKKDYGARLMRLPTPPSSLSERAKSEWKAIGRAAIGLGTLTAADLRALELLANILAGESEARETIQSEGITIATGDGGQKAHPALKAMEMARSQASRLLADFGLTPRSRQSIDVQLPAPGSAADKYLDQHRS